MAIPAGLATIAARLDDNPAERGAVAFCRALAERREAAPDRAIVDHARLAISYAYRARDARAIVYRADGRVEVVR